MLLAQGGTSNTTYIWPKLLLETQKETDTQIHVKIQQKPPPVLDNTNLLHETLTAFAVSVATDCSKSSVKAIHACSS